MIYTVKRGDTLGELMFAWKVQGIEIEKLYSWNLGLGTQIKIGQEIIYYLPERPGERVKLNEQEIKKVVEATIEARAKEPPSIPGNSKTGQALNLLLVSAVIAVIILAVAISLALLLRRRGGRKTNPEVVAIELEGKGLYVTDIELDPATGKWFTPFRHINGGDRMWGKTEGDARRSAQKCWRETEKYGDQIQKLIKQGIIREKNKQAAA